MGSDIVFAGGVSQSHSLLAHELAHVAQPSQGKPAIQRSPDPEAEREAARKEAIEALAAMDRQEALDDAKEKEEEEKPRGRIVLVRIGLSTLDPKTLCGGRPCMTNENLAAIEKKSRKELDDALKEVDDREDEIGKIPYKTRLNEARKRCWAARGDYSVYQSSQRTKCGTLATSYPSRRPRYIKTRERYGKRTKRRESKPADSLRFRKK